MRGAGETTSDGALGDNFAELDSTTPVPVAGSFSFTAIAVGESFGCGVVIAAPSLNEVCWGRGIDGEIGNSDTGQVGQPTATVPTITNIQSIAVGELTACAVVAGNDLLCWGANDNGELGTGDIVRRDTPTLVGTNMVGVATRGEHTCAVVTGGAIECWGVGDDGQLGDGNFQSSTIAVNVGMIVGFDQLAAGDIATCAAGSFAALPSGMACWGSNIYGQLGDPLVPSVGAPNVVNIPVEISAIAMGSNHTCALDETGVVWCWGDNAHGEQGIGTFSRALTPVTVAFP